MSETHSVLFQNPFKMPSFSLRHENFILNYAMCNKNSSIVIGSRLFRGFLGSYLSPISFRFAIPNLPAPVRTLPPLDLATGHQKVRFCVLSHILVECFMTKDEFLLYSTLRIFSALIFSSNKLFLFPCLS